MSIYRELTDEIRRQQEGKKGKPEFYIGEQLLEITKRREKDAEILLCDITRKEMNLEAAAKKLKDYADKHHGKESVYCIEPETAAEILREFYGLTGFSGKEEPEEGLIDLGDYI